MKDNIDIKRKSRFDKPERPKKTVRAKLANIIMIILLTISIYILFTFGQVYFTARNNTINKNTKADVILVLGAAQFNGMPSKGDQSTEASASANYLIKKGVDDSVILREVNGISTYDSLRDSAKFLKEKKLSKVILVTDGFHELRSKLIAQDFGLSVITAPVKDSPITGSTEWKNFFTETGRVSLGRVIGFRRVSRDSSLAHLIK